MDDPAFTDHIKRAPYVNATGEFPPSETGPDAASLRVPPHSAEAEQSVLGALLLDSSSLAKVSDILVVGDFYAYQHKLLFDVITGLVEDGFPVDVITTFERAQRDGNADAVGGLVYLNQLAQSVPSAANIRRYAEVIVERATRRSIIALSDEAATRAFRGDQVADILDDSKVRLGKLAEARNLGKAGVPLLSLAQLRDQAHELQWLVKHVVPADSLGMVFGASQTFKSFVVLDMALHVAHGLPWLGRRTTQGPVIYIAAEGGTGLWGRICAWHKARGRPYEKTPMHVVPVAVDLTKDAWRIVEQVQALGITPALVVVDTLSQTYAGEENSANEVAAYFRELGARMRQLWHCAVTIIHHSGHNATERPRGSTAMAANVDWMFGVHRDEKEMLATLSCTKQKDGEGFADATFSLSPQRLGTDADGDEVRSLVARHLTSVEDLQDAMERESKAGRGGNNHLLLSLLENGVLEKDLRQLFMRDCGAETPESRRQAWSRARAWGLKSGFFEVANGFIITLKNGGAQP